MILSLSSTGLADEEAADLAQRIERVEWKTKRLQEQIAADDRDEQGFNRVMVMLRTIEKEIVGLKEEIKTHEEEECMRLPETKKWDQFFRELDAKNGGPGL